MKLFALRMFTLICVLSLFFYAYSEDTSATAGAPGNTDSTGNAAPASAPASGSEQTVVTIKSARKTGNKKNELDGSDELIFEGNVVISVQKGTTTTVISADRVNYNRANDMLFAEGSVKLEKNDSNTGSETATADSLLFNTATLEGIFDNGRIVQTQTDSLNLPSGSTLIVASDVFGRDDSSTITFKNGALTFCDADPPHWRIKASRIWLLPGGEFAFFNALLYVGDVPLLYLPAFWYPKDELIFNPVFGYRSREGYFVQMTTYIFGRKPLSAYDVGEQYTSDSDTDSSDDTSSSTTSTSDDSYYSFIKPSKLKDQERQGLMLHNLETDYKGDTTSYAKIMTDWYSNLGYMFGVDSVYKPSGGYLTDLEINGQLGFSNTIFEQSSQYLPYSSSGTSYDDSSNFLGYELPFRYSANLKLVIAKPFSLTISLPLYSDPYFAEDFGDRTETMDWIDYLTSNPSTDTTDTDDDDTSSEISSFTWSLSGSYTQALPDSIKPYISTLAITSLSSSVIFSSLTNTVISGSSSDTDDWKSYTPERKFYYPSQVDPIQITGKIAGTLFSYGTTDSSSGTKKQESVKMEVPLKAPADLDDGSSQKAEEIPDKDKNIPASEGTQPPQAEGGGDQTGLASDALPDLAFSPDAIKNMQGINYALTYAVTPSYTTEFTYSSTGLTQPEDFDWKRLKSTMYTVKVPVNLTSTAGYRESFISLTDAFDFSPVYQWHPYLSTDTTYGGYSSSSIDSIREADYEARTLDLTNTNALSFKPFYYTDNFKNTGLSWNTTVKMVRTEFIGDADNPEWEYLTTDLTDEDCVTVNTLDLTLAATEYGDDFGQSLVLSTKLPPQVDEYYGTLTLTFPYTTLTVESGIEQVSSTDSTWEKEPFKEALSVKLFSNSLTFTQSYTYELEDGYPDALKLAFAWNDFQLAYTAKYTYGYDFNDDSGWEIRDYEEFQPYSASFAYATTKKTYHYWKNRISWAPTLSTSIVYDCLRPTNSYFKFVPAITLQINEFLDLTFSSESRNDNIYRYFQSMTGNAGRIPGETNMFKDLLNSFRFDDETLRKSSGFKLNSLSVKITHELCDWNLSAAFKVSPRLVTASDGTKSYDFSPYFTISVVWRPMSGMKTKVVDKYGDWELNP